MFSTPEGQSEFPSEFDHFLAAQHAIYDQVLAELAQGRKESHWMWFIFPQLRGLGSSQTAQRYALDSIAQARRYLSHPILGQRLRQCTRLMLQWAGLSLRDILGPPDDLKFRSSMTLFNLAAPDEPLFQDAMRQFFQGEPDPRTLALLNDSD